MDLQQLRYFLIIAEAGSFSEAAQRLGMTQPSLSQQMKKLEKGLGTPLFDRLPRGVVLTEAGQRLQERARDLVAGAEAAEREVRDCTGRVSGKLVVGAIPTIAPYLLPTVIQRYTRKYPDVELHLEENVTGALLHSLHDGELDVGIMSAPIPTRHLMIEPIFEEPLSLAMPAGHPLCKKKRVTWADLNDQPLLVLGEMHCLGDQVTAFCRRHRAGMAVTFRASQIATMLQMVALGTGLTLLPALAVQEDQSKKRVYKPLADAPPTRMVVAVQHLLRFRTNAARAFLSELLAFPLPQGARRVR